ncbi:hypothetical protein JHN63_01195 [Streptomyces sp. MBT65]|uniref:hypothetical protein n=1 Tax=Streptomyces sp. MBT65 TaxID=1488395 RepID=UPI00190B7B62|nr:hypothetical protein [Streptomyces sp. MBT65]MBK3572460.1 hypothetical protein [Streptomyces sp. MBT65]
MSSSIPPLRHGVVGPLLTVAASGATLVLLAACDGAGGTRDEGVASIASPSASVARTTAAPDAGHVRIRLDDDQDDVNRLWDAWTHCLTEHGLPKGQKAVDSNPAVKACVSKYPLQPVEMDPARNPRYSDGVRAMVKCMNAHGIKSVVSEGNWAMASGDSMNLPDYDKYKVECQVKSFENDA